MQLKALNLYAKYQQYLQIKIKMSQAVNQKQ